MKKNIKNSKSALIGLIILFAVSIVMAGGRIPKNEQYSTTLRPLSRNETKVLVERVPTILNEALGTTFPDFKDKLKSDTGFKSSLDLGLKELSNPLLRQFFPKVSFYSLQILHLSGSPRPRVLEAVVGNKLYEMPTNFNRLLVEHNLEINDKNIIKLAKAFVIIALEGQEITFLEGKRINKRIKGEGPYQAMVKLKRNDKIVEWYFYVSPVENGQFQGVSILELSTGRFHHRFFPLIVTRK